MIPIWREPKIIGACVVGVALVAGAYTVRNVTLSDATREGTLMAVTNANPGRVYIEPTDSDGDGIEDWQREFVSNQPIVEAESTSTEPFTPDTLTDQVAVEFLESILLARGAENMGITEEQVIAQTAERFNANVIDTLYGEADITTVPDSPVAIRTYGNTMGNILITNNVPDSRGELEIIDQAVRNSDAEVLQELQPLIDMYAALRDQSLATPVPEMFVKEHLDLINMYHALYTDLSGMQQVLDDAATALLRIKRYQDNATGLFVALQNMYSAIVPYADLFTVEDPVIVFLPYGPNN